MGNWIPGDPTLIAHILKTCAVYTPAPPAGFISPVTWGVEENVRARFAAAGIPADAIACERETYTFRYPGKPSDFLTVFRDYYGPTMNAFDAAEASGRRAELQAELERLFESQNRSTTGATEIPATYLKVTVQV